LLKSVRGMCIILAPPLLYVILLIGTSMWRRRNENPLGQKSRKAITELAKTIRLARHADTQQQARILILEGYKNHLGDKLAVRPGALTFEDICSPLVQRGVDQHMLSLLRDLFSECEAARYGNFPESRIENIVEFASDLSAKLDGI
jgi:hypothetical protein